LTCGTADSSVGTATHGTVCTGRQLQVAVCLELELFFISSVCRESLETSGPPVQQFLLSNVC
jgi:hypothetical protein